MAVWGKNVAMELLVLRGHPQEQGGLQALSLLSRGCWRAGLSFPWNLRGPLLQWVWAAVLLLTLPLPLGPAPAPSSLSPRASGSPVHTPWRCPVGSAGRAGVGRGR